MRTKADSVIVTRPLTNRHRCPRKFCAIAAIAIVLHVPLCGNVAAQVPDDTVLSAEQQRIAVMRRAAQATVAIFTPGGQGGGSGVLISADGYALSNFHVTSLGPELECGLNDGKIYPAVIVGLDPTGDVALIRLLGRDDFPHAPLGDSDQVRAGDWVFAAGNPFLLADDFQPSISYGIVSGVHRYQYPSGTLLEYADCIQTDAAINPGNSGGPLFNASGSVVGINGRGSFEKRGRVNVGVGYAISINQIKKFMGYLKSGRIVDHATLGATVAADDEGQIYVNDIVDTSDAYRRGLRYGDRILQFAGRDIGSVNTFKNVLGTFPRGWRVPITFEHEGEVLTKWVRLVGVHREGELARRIAKGSHRQSPRPNPGRQPRPAEPDQPGSDPESDPESDPNSGPDNRDAREADEEGPSIPNPSGRDSPEKGPGERPAEEPADREKEADGRGSEAEDDAPNSDEPPAQPDEQPRRPGQPAPSQPGKPTPPPAARQPHLTPLVQDHFQAREGYANYYFNLQHVRRVWNAFENRAQLSEAPPVWTITGISPADEVVSLRLSGREGELVSPRGRFSASFEFGDLLDAAETPPNSGGLLVALHAWQRLLLLGPERFGEVFYLGTMPLPTWELETDVLVGMHAGIEARFYFAPQTGDLVSLELYSDVQLDPCEIIYSDFRAEQGRYLPFRWEIRYGDAVYEQIEIQSYEFAESETSE